MDRYLELTRHAELIKPGGDDALLDYIESEAKREWPEDRHTALAYECGHLRGTVRTLIARIEQLHEELAYAASEACNSYAELNKRRLLEQYGIDLDAMAAALEAGDEPEQDPDDEDEAEVVAGLNREYVADQMRGMRRVA